MKTKLKPPKPLQSLLIVTAMALSFFVVTSSPTTVNAAHTTTPEIACATELKRLFETNTLTQAQMTYCAAAFNIITTTKPYDPTAALAYCRSSSSSSDSLAGSACNAGERLGIEAVKSGHVIIRCKSDQRYAEDKKKCVDKSKPQPKCKSDQVYSTAQKKCVDRCKSGQAYSKDKRKCVTIPKCKSPKILSADKTKCIDKPKPKCKSDQVYSNDKKKCVDKSNPTGAGTSGVDPAIECKDKNCDLIGKYVNPAINLFSVAFGLIAIISIILGSINYAMSEGDPQKASKAKKRIVDTVFAVVAYIFLFSFLQFLIPGGAFR